MENDLLNQNLNNIKEDVDLFGEKHKRLAVMDRIGFIPLSIWKPNWEIVKQLKDLIGDAGQTRELENKMNLLGSKYNTSIFNPHLWQCSIKSHAHQFSNNGLSAPSRRQYGTSQVL